MPHDGDDEPATDTPGPQQVEPLWWLLAEHPAAGLAFTARTTQRRCGTATDGTARSR
jgi:hypothetical protein